MSQRFSQHALIRYRIHFIWLLHHYFYDCWIQSMFSLFKLAIIYSYEIWVNPVAMNDLNTSIIIIINIKYLSNTYDEYFSSPFEFKKLGFLEFQKKNSLFVWIQVCFKRAISNYYSTRFLFLFIMNLFLYNNYSCRWKC